MSLLAHLIVVPVMLVVGARNLLRYALRTLFNLYVLRTLWRMHRPRRTP